MNRITQRFTHLKKAGRKALITYLTAGDPNPQVTVPLLLSMVKAGADILEIGVPFSDPMAEGPVIQRAMERALTHHLSLRQVLEMVKQFRLSDKDTPIVLMGYLNPVEVMGYEQFVSAAASAGVDGVLLVDMPPEEATDLVAFARKANIDMIFLVSPTTTDSRIRAIAEASGGFVYYVSLKGVTGAGHLDIAAVQERVTLIKSMSTLPVGVGFGIKDALSAGQIAKVADAVVVGSALVKLVETNQDNTVAMQHAVTTLIKGMRDAMDENVPQSRAAGV